MAAEPPARERALGALTGLALGDALGMPTQSMSPARIRRCYGTITGLRDAVAEQPIAPSMPAGSVTDDTEQALILAGLLIDGGGHVDPHHLAEALLTWEDDMRTQDGYLKELARIISEIDDMYTKADQDAASFWPF